MIENFNKKVTETKVEDLFPQYQCKLMNIKVIPLNFWIDVRRQGTEAVFG